MLRRRRRVRAQVSLPGLYLVSASFFAASCPAVSLIVNGTTVIRRVATKRAVGAESIGLVAGATVRSRSDPELGLECNADSARECLGLREEPWAPRVSQVRDFISIPANAHVAVGFDAYGATAADAQGFLELRKL